MRVIPMQNPSECLDSLKLLKPHQQLIALQLLGDIQSSWRASDLPLAKTNLVRDFLTTFHIQDKVVPGFDCEERGEQSLSAEHIVMETEGPALPQKQSEFQPTHKPN